MLKTTEVSFINKHRLYFFEDKIGNINFKQAQKQSFAPVTSPNNSFGFSQSSFWFRFKLQNPNTSQTDWMLEVPYPLLDYLDFYYQKEGVWKKIALGDLVPFEQRPFYSHNFVIPLKVSPQKIHTYYFRLKTSSDLQLPLNVSAPAVFHKKHNQEALITHIEYGILLVMIIYNLFIFLSLRNISYLLYSLSILSALLLIMNLKGDSLQYLWPHYPQFNNDSLLFFVSLFDCFFLLYAIYFLRTRQHTPRLSRILLMLAIIVPITGIISFINIRLAVILVLPISSVMGLLVIYASVICYRKGFVSARFFILAWVVLLIGAPIHSLRISTGIIPSTFLIQHLIDFGIVLAVVLLSLALVDSYRHEKTNKEVAQKKLLEIQKDANEKLEAKVKERTHQLQEKTNEVVAQNEELQQQQEEINAQNEFIAATHRKLKKESNKTMESIQAASHIQNAILPAQSVLSNLFGNEYFVIYKPKDIVSGDFYWVSKVKAKFKVEDLWQANQPKPEEAILQLTTKTLDSRETIFVAVVDCTGHGVPGAFMSMIGNSLLNEIINESMVLETHEILNRLNERVKKGLQQGEKDKLGNGMDVCLCKLEKLEDGSTQVHFTGSKRSLFYYHQEQLFEIKGDRISIGGFSKEQKTSFNTHKIHLQSGDMLYLTTDGYVDAPNISRKSFGTARFKRLMESSAPLPIGQQKQKFEQVLKAFSKGTEQRDDITIMGIRV